MKKAKIVFALFFLCSLTMFSCQGKNIEPENLTIQDAKAVGEGKPTTPPPPPPPLPDPD